MSTNKTIAKNTLFLYVRMLLVMGVSLFTSRIVLRELGTEDYGIYALVGGFVALFNFLNYAMTAATQRYLSYDIGNEDDVRLQKTFSASLTIHIGIAIIILLLAESIGFWYVNNIMVFPPERMSVVNIVYQFSIATTLIGIIQVPYNALIIARERMNVYAYVSIIEVILKLIIVFVLVYINSDKLMIYAILTFVISLISRLIYQMYCRNHFRESKYRFEYDKVYYEELVSYSGWNLFENIGSVARGQGSNVVLNLFFGVVANAAYGITLIVQAAISNFIRNFQVAVNPQITKKYAKGEIKSMHKLINQSSKFSFLLALLLISPVLLNLDFILKMWLITPPTYTFDLIFVCLLCLLVDSLSGPLNTGIQATGKIRMYQIIVGCLIFINLPVTYILFEYNLAHSPNIIFKIWLIFSLVSLIFRLFLLKKLLGFSIELFIRDVISKIILLGILSLIIGYGLELIFVKKTLVMVGMETLIYSSILIGIVYFLILNKNEKLFLSGTISKTLLNK